MIFKKITAAVLAAMISLSVLVSPVYAAEASSAASSTSALPEKYLEGNELELYRLLLECMVWTSEGRRDAHTFYLNVSRAFASTAEYEKAIKKVMFFIHNYAPEYSYWADSSGYRAYDTKRCGIIYGISPAYETLGNQYMISSKRLDDVSKALKNAKEIADKYQGQNDFKKVIGYAKEICALTDYDKAAERADSESGYSQKNIDPWTIINVFDKDPSTNVVCAGYAKAFQYLCGLGGIECHYVTGYVPGGYHGWNIVVIDGKNYFVDLTACDSYPEDIVEKYHPFVLNGVVSSTAEGFSTHFSRSGLSYGNEYTYAENEQEYLPEELRILTTKACFAGGSKVGAVIAVVLLVGAVIFLVVKKKREESYY